MAQIRPFAGIHFAKDRENLSGCIAPPYDVLDEKDRAALQAKHPHNIVNIDLPHIPPKAAGPADVYEKANLTLRAWLQAGILKKDARAAFYPYTQTFEQSGRTYHRRGLFALVRLSPFGAGQVVPHEKTYKGPIEDRLALMRATNVQLSPIFGLFNDPKNEVTGALFKNLGRPLLSGTINNVKNDLWSVIDADIENQVIDLMGTRPVYIADGHHRYTTALQFQEEARVRAGGTLPQNHPANFCLFVLVGMQDDGLLILPTHRLIGGLENFDVAAFKAALGDHFEMTQTTLKPADLPEAVHKLGIDNSASAATFGLYDGKNQTLYWLRLKNQDVLKPYEPGQSDAWRRLDVSILQRYLLDEVLQPKFAGGRELVKGYTADAAAVAPQTDGAKYQIALLLRPTPLHALEELGKHKEVMPQKSTFFFPKLATGMVMNPLE